MRLAVFGDAHAHAEALDAVLAAADRAGVDALWSLGDMIGGGPDPAHVVRGHARALPRRADGQPRLRGDGIGGAVAARRRRRPRSSSRARRCPRTTSRGCGRAARPRAARACSAGTAARATRCGSSSARRTRTRAWRVQKADLGLVAHTHVAAAFTPERRRVRIRVGRAARPVRRQVAAQPGRGRRTRPAAARLVRRARRGGRGRRVLARARPARPHRHLAPRPLRPPPRPRTSPTLGIDD